MVRLRKESEDVTSRIRCHSSSVGIHGSLRSRRMGPGERNEGTPSPSNLCSLLSTDRPVSSKTFRPRSLPEDRTGTEERGPDSASGWVRCHRARPGKHLTAIRVACGFGHMAPLPRSSRADPIERRSSDPACMCQEQRGTSVTFASCRDASR